MHVGEQRPDRSSVEPTRKKMPPSPRERKHGKHVLVVIDEAIVEREQRRRAIETGAGKHRALEGLRRR